MENEVTKVRERLANGDLWLQDSMGAWREVDSEVCLLGAVRHVVEHTPIHYGYGMTEEEKVIARRIMDVVRVRYPHRVEEFDSAECDAYLVTEFNDHPNTTWEDVNLVLKEVESRCA